jgi:cardiolipin synthase
MRTYLPAESIELVHSGSDFFDRLIQLLEHASESIHFQTYIFENDGTGSRVAKALQAAAERGVSVWLIVDQFGSKNLSVPFIENLQKSGVRFRFFNQAVSFWKWRFGRTLHHKVVVVDGVHALVGGINIADKYHGTAGQAAWLDFAVYVRGAVCLQLAQLCTDIFKHQFWKNHLREKGRSRLLPEGTRDGMVRFRLNDWVRRKTEVYQSYAQGISSARKSIVLTVSYFLPGRSVRQRLKAAVRRGVEVRILLTGPSDVNLSRQAEQFLISWMLRRGMRVFRWEQSVMHGKTMLVDGHWTTLGSYNINRLSRFRSLELNLDIADPGFNAHFSLTLDALLLQQCTEITTENNPDFSSSWRRWKARIAYHVAVYLMRLFFSERR